MNLLIRDVDVAFVKEIERKSEEVSKKIGRNFSRNEYIKMLIQHDCDLRLVQLKEDKFDQAVGNLNETIERQERVLQDYINSTNRLFHILASGIDISERVDEL